MRASLQVFVLLAASCTPTLQTHTAAPTLATPVPRTDFATYDLSAKEARGLANIVGFIESFNRGDVERGLSFFSQDAVVSDCDYAAKTQPSFRGVGEIEQWLRERAADDDEIELGRLFNQNPSEPGLGVGLAYLRRSSTTLRARGFSEGIDVHGVPKVAFTADGRIRAFVYGTAAECTR